MKAAGAILACLLAAVAGAAAADDNVLLIQSGPQGQTVWHTEGASQLEDDDILEIMATATPEGGAEMPTPLGPARAYALSEATLIRLPAVQGDNALLVERDACGHIKVWHAAGTTQLTPEQIDEALLTALPGGGKRLVFGAHYAKGFVNNLGVTVTLWRAPRKPAP
jgi:hypothetical protein